MDDTSPIANITINQQNFAYVDRNGKLAYGIINLFLAVFTTLSNTFVLLVICKAPPLRTRSSVLLASLAISDLLVGILLDPLTSLMLLSSSIQEVKIVNLLRRFISVLSVGGSIGSIAVISYDRYVHLSKMLRYLEVMTKRKIVVVLSISWASPIIVPVFRLITRDDRIHGALLVMLIVIYFAVIVVSYLFTISLVKQKEKQVLGLGQCNRQIKNSLRAARAIALIITFFLLMVTPITIYNLLLAAHDFGVDGLEWFAGAKRDNVYVFCMTAVQANSAVNPVIYFLRTPGFRRQFKKMCSGAFQSNTVRYDVQCVRERKLDDTNENDIEDHSSEITKLKQKISVECQKKMYILSI